MRCPGSWKASETPGNEVTTTGAHCALHSISRFEKSETFRVALKDPSANAELDEGGSLAMVTICNDDELKKKSSWSKWRVYLGRRRPHASRPLLGRR